MDAEFDNPLGRLLKLFREIDRNGIAETKLGETVTRYDLTEAMLVLANVQVAQLNLSIAVSNRDKDEIRRFTDVYASQLSSIVELAVWTGGSEFAEKVLASMGPSDEQR